VKLSGEGHHRGLPCRVRGFARISSVAFSILTVAVLLLGAGLGSNFDFSTLSFDVPLLGSSAARTDHGAVIPTTNNSA
jgi:hypothetical protein